MKKNIFYAIIAAIFLAGCGEGGNGGKSMGVGSDSAGLDVSVPAGQAKENGMKSHNIVGNNGSDSMTLNSVSE